MPQSPDIIRVDESKLPIPAQLRTLRSRIREVKVTADEAAASTGYQQVVVLAAEADPDPVATTGPILFFRPTGTPGQYRMGVAV